MNLDTFIYRVGTDCTRISCRTEAPRLSHGTLIIPAPRVPLALYPSATDRTLSTGVLMREGRRGHFSSGLGRKSCRDARNREKPSPRTSRDGEPARSSSMSCERATLADKEVYTLPARSVITYSVALFNQSFYRPQRKREKVRDSLCRIVLYFD